MAIIARTSRGGGRSYPTTTTAIIAILSPDLPQQFLLLPLPLPQYCICILARYAMATPDPL
jgi:hypothetical protein